ncbi:MAG: PAS domain-containing protein [Pseudomonadota bacterium]
MFHVWHTLPDAGLPVSGASDKVMHMAVQATNGPVEDILHPAARDVFAVWDAIRQGRSAPCRSELDLRSIKRLLPNIALIERHPLKFEFSFRLAGTGLRKIFGKELTDKDFMAIWPRVERSTIAGLASDVILRHKPASIRFKGFTSDGRAETIELLMLPLLPARRNVTHILATMVPVAEPYWLGDQPVVRTELISIREIWIESFSDTTAPAAPAPATSGQIETAARLQLIRGGID